MENNKVLGVASLRPILDTVFSAIGKSGGSGESSGLYRGMLDLDDLKAENFEKTFGDNPLGVWGVRYPKESVELIVRELLEGEGLSKIIKK